MRILLSRKSLISLSIILIRSGRGSGSTSRCASKTKILTWTGKYKLGAIAKARVGIHNLGIRTGKCKVLARVDKHKLGARAGKYKLGARASKNRLGARAGKYRPTDFVKLKKKSTYFNTKFNFSVS